MRGTVHYTPQEKLKILLEIFNDKASADEIVSRYPNASTACKKNFTMALFTRNGVMSGMLPDLASRLTEEGTKRFNEYLIKHDIKKARRPYGSLKKARAQGIATEMVQQVKRVSDSLEVSRLKAEINKLKAELYDLKFGGANE